MSKKEQKLYKTAKGESVPASAVSVSDKRKDKVVNKLIKQALKLYRELDEFKDVAYSECDKLYNQNLELKGVDATTKKGNYTLYSYDKSMKIEMNISSVIKFSDDIAIAQAKIDEYLDEATREASDDLRTIVRRAFTTSRAQLDKARILSLFQYQIKHPLWLEAMEIIKGAIEVSETKRYMAFSTRDSEGEYLPILLNFAAI